MKKVFLFLSMLLGSVSMLAQGIDMQAHVASDEGLEAYQVYQERQMDYYNGTYSYNSLILLNGNDLFGALNTLMGNTCLVGGSSFSYNSLRNEYVNVDRDLNKKGNIIGYYDGSSMNGTWDGGATYNREHTWPQSKGANKDTPMGHDMQSVRPTSAKVNSERGNDAYGESSGYYDPEDVEINNSYYKSSNKGTYRGDCSRVVLYDYVVYGEAGGHKNKLCINNAQLLNKLGSSGVFENIEILIKWHMQDPPSLTEMVRNDGAEDYQGNRNPFIDYPELAIQMLKNEVTTYTVTSNQVMAPNYTLTTKHGFVTYLTAPNGEHPTQVSVDGANYEYSQTTGRLTITDVQRAVTITSSLPTLSAVDNSSSEGKINWYRQGSNVLVTQTAGAVVNVYSLSGVLMYTESGMDEYTFTLPQGLYIISVGDMTDKVVVY